MYVLLLASKTLGTPGCNTISQSKVLYIVAFYRKDTKALTVGFLFGVG